MTEYLVIAKKERVIIRDNVTKSINKIETLVHDADADNLDLEETLEQLNESSRRVSKIKAF